MDKFLWIWFIANLQIIVVFSKPHFRPKRFTEFSIQCREYNDFTWECLCPQRNVIMTLKNSDDAFLVCGIDFKLSLLSKTPHYQANQQELASDYDRMVQHERPTKNLWGDQEYHRSSSFERGGYDPFKDPKGYKTGVDWNELEPNTHFKHNTHGNKEGYDRSRPGYNIMEPHSRKSQRYSGEDDRYMNTQDEKFQDEHLQSKDGENGYNQNPKVHFGNHNTFQSGYNLKTNNKPLPTTTDLFQRNPLATITTPDGMISQEKLDENLNQVLSGYSSESSEINDTNTDNDEQIIQIGVDSKMEDTSLEKEENFDEEVPEHNSENGEYGKRPTYEQTHDTTTRNALISKKEVPIIPIYTTEPIKSTLLQSSKTVKIQTVSEQKVKPLSVKTTVPKKYETVTMKPTVNKNGRTMTVKPAAQQKTHEAAEIHDNKQSHKTDVNQDANRPEITINKDTNGQSSRLKTDRNIVTKQKMNVIGGTQDKGDFREDPEPVLKANNITNEKSIHDSRYAGDTTGISAGEEKDDTSEGCYFFGKMFSVGQFLKISYGCIMVCVKQNMMKRDCTGTHTLQNKPDPDNAIANWHP